MTIRDVIGVLEQAGLVRLGQEEPELTYLFRHALVQDAAYESLLRSDRRRLHRVVGEVLEQLYHAQRDEMAPVLGHHFWEAQEPARALRYFIIAADSAFRLSALPEAIEHYAHAAAVAAEGQARPEEVVHIYRRWGRALELLGRYEAVREHYQALETLGRTQQQPALELAGMLAIATLHVTPTPLHNATQGQAVLDRALALAERLGDQAAQAHVFWNLSLLHAFMEGEPAQIVTYGERAVALARPLGETELLAYSLNDVASYGYRRVGRFQEALVALTEAEALWRKLGSKAMLADNLIALADIYINLGALQKAKPLLEEALIVSQEMGNLWGQANSLWTMSQIYMEWGEFGRAIEVLEAAQKFVVQSGFQGALVIQGHLAMMYAMSGERARALEIARNVHPSLNVPMPRVLQGALATALAIVYALCQAMTEAEALFTEMQDELLREGMIIAALGYVAWGEMRLIQGRYTEALEAIGLFLSRFDQTGTTFLVPDALFCKAKALVLLGQEPEAYEVLQEARTKAEAMNSRRTLWFLLGLLSQLEAQRGNMAEAAALHARAIEIISFIADHTGADTRRVLFLNLPEVQEVLAKR